MTNPKDCVTKFRVFDTTSLSRQEQRLVGTEAAPPVFVKYGCASLGRGRGSWAMKRCLEGTRAAVRAAPSRSASLPRIEAECVVFV